MKLSIQEFVENFKSGQIKLLGSYVILVDNLLKEFDSNYEESKIYIDDIHSVDDWGHHIVVRLNNEFEFVVSDDIFTIGDIEQELNKVVVLISGGIVDNVFTTVISDVEIIDADSYEDYGKLKKDIETETQRLKYGM